MQLDLLAAEQPRIGESNGRFLGDLANGVSLAQLRANWKGGKYPGLNDQIARDNLAFWRLA